MRLSAHTFRQVCSSSRAVASDKLNGSAPILCNQCEKISHDSYIFLWQTHQNHIWKMPNRANYDLPAKLLKLIENEAVFFILFVLSIIQIHKWWDIQRDSVETREFIKDNNMKEECPIHIPLPSLSPSLRRLSGRFTEVDLILRTNEKLPFIALHCQNSEALYVMMCNKRSIPI